MSTRDWQVEEFEQHRPQLEAVAYRMLGSVSEADDALQEAWLRLAIGDTTAAVRQLDLVLNALPTLGQWAVREEAQAAARKKEILLKALSGSPNRPGSIRSQ